MNKRLLPRRVVVVLPRPNFNANTNISPSQWKNAPVPLKRFQSQDANQRKIYTRDTSVRPQFSLETEGRGKYFAFV